METILAATLLADLRRTVLPFTNPINNPNAIKIRAAGSAPPKRAAILRSRLDGAICAASMMRCRPFVNKKIPIANQTNPEKRIRCVCLKRIAFLLGYLKTLNIPYLPILHPIKFMFVDKKLKGFYNLTKLSICDFCLKTS